MRARSIGADIVDAIALIVLGVIVIFAMRSDKGEIAGIALGIIPVVAGVRNVSKRANDKRADSTLPPVSGVLVILGAVAGGFYEFSKMVTRS